MHGSSMKEPTMVFVFVVEWHDGSEWRVEDRTFSIEEAKAIQRTLEMFSHCKTRITKLLVRDE